LIGGAVIVEVLPDTPAERAGLEEGDVIVAVDRQRLVDGSDLADIIAGYEPGDRVTLAVRRSGAEDSLQVQLSLGEHPDKEGSPYLGVRYSSDFSFEMPGTEGLPRRRMEEFNWDELPDLGPEGSLIQGVVVVAVDDESPASAAGLQPGDVITALDEEPVGSQDELVERIGEREPRDRVTITFFRPGDEGEHEVEVTLGEHPEQDGKAYLGVRIGGSFRMFHSEQGGLPGEFRFYQAPFHPEVPFGEVPGHLDDLPFDLDDLPFDLDDLQHEFDFDFQWPPIEDECDGGPGCDGGST
jgi:hypothetical protein